MSTVASTESIQFATDLLFERGFDGYPVEDLAGMEQRAISRMISDLLSRPAAPATDEQREQIAALADELGYTIVPGADRKKCRRQIASLSHELKVKTWGREVAETHAELDLWAEENGVQIAA